LIVCSDADILHKEENGLDCVLVKYFDQTAD